MFVLFLLVLNLTTAEEEKVEEGGTGEERKDAIAKILSMDRMYSKILSMD